MANAKVWVGLHPVLKEFLILIQSVSPGSDLYLPFPGGIEPVTGAVVYRKNRPQHDIHRKHKRYSKQEPLLKIACHFHAFR